MQRRAGALVIALALAATTGCGSGHRPSTADGITIEASFYPLQWMAQQVGGSGVSVDSLTKPGAEPHDLELSPQDVAAVADADLVVYLSGFQPAVDEAVAGQAPDTSLDVARAARLDLTYTPIEEGSAVRGQAASTDPHFWLDPIRLAGVGDAFAARLGRLDPNNASTYTANAAALRVQLEQLDSDYAEGLRDCTNTDLVTSHNAFGYLARAYGLTQEGITGLIPEEEPSAADLAAVTAFVQEHDVHTIYYETLVGPDIAATVARETGARTAVLDPIEGLTDASQGADYLAVMRSNLRNLRAGQPCR